MKLNELKTNPGSTHRRKIVGRGPGSGLGKTSAVEKKVKKLVQEQALNLGLKVDKIHYIKEYQEEDLTMQDLL